MPTKTLNKKDVDVIYQWLKDEISLTDVGKHFQLFNGNIYNKIALTLRQAYKDGKLIIK